MDSPFIYLTFCSWRNRLRIRLRRLREPRYLIGLVVGVGYFTLIFGRPFFFRRGRDGAGGPGVEGPASPLDALSSTPAGQVGSACLLFLALALAWIWPSKRKPALAFTRADVQFLFTAPIPRWQLVRYKVVRSQLAALFGSAIITLFIRRPASFMHAWTFFLGFGLLMATINLHLTGITLTRDPATRAGRLIRNFAPIAVVVAIVALIGRDLLAHSTEIANASASGNGATEVARVMSSGLSGVVLWPFRALLSLPLSRSRGEFVAALPWTLLALGLNYLWVLRTDAPFEEASAELAEKVARIRKEGLKALRQPRAAAKMPFRLASDGPAEMAILWKNLISMGRFASWTLLLRFVPALFVVSMAAGMGLTRGAHGNTARTDGLALIALIIAGFTLLLGPQMARADLRQDLPNLGVLRTWPLRGATLVRGEVLAPAVVLVTVAWLALLVAGMFAAFGMVHRDIDAPWAYLTAAIAITPGIILLQLLVQNALVVTFPSWVSVGPPRGGVDVMGQRMLMMGASFLALVLALLPAALVAVVVAGLLRLLTSSLPIVLPAVAAAVVLIAEAFVASELIGRILDRTDVGALDPTES
jgi:ABC-2 type transport system permease protein